MGEFSVSFNDSFEQDLYPNANCDCLCKNRPSSHHKLKSFFVSSLQLYSIAIITLHIQSPFLISLLFSGLLLTVCKCGFDTMVPVERAKWMTSAWDCTLGYGCVHWTSRPTMDCSGVHLFTVELLWTVFHKLLPPPSPPPHPHPPARPPPQYAGPKLVHTFKKTI